MGNNSPGFRYTTERCCTVLGRHPVEFALCRLHRELAHGPQLIMLGFVGWALGLVFVMVLMRMAATRIAPRAMSRSGSILIPT